jgi:hypothetical protein
MADVAKQVDILFAGLRNPNTDEPLSGGQVKTYLDSTSTEVNLWTDRDKTAQTTNPIDLDVQGRAEVYGDDIYKFEVFDSSGVKVDTLYGLDIFVEQSVRTWSSVHQFFKGEVTRTATALYRAVQDNQGVDPDTDDGTKWTPLLTGKDLDSNGGTVLVEDNLAVNGGTVITNEGSGGYTMSIDTNGIPYLQEV